MVRKSKKTQKEPETVIPVQSETVVENVQNEADFPFWVDFGGEIGIKRFSTANAAICEIARRIGNGDKFVVFNKKRRVIGIDLISRDFWFIHALKSVLESEGIEA